MDLISNQTSNFLLLLHYMYVSLFKEFTLLGIECSRMSNSITVFSCWDWPSTIQFVDGTYWSCILQLRYWLLNLSSQHASAMMCRKIWSQCKQLFSLCEQAVCLKKEYGVLSVNKVCQRKRQTAPLKQSEECWLHWVSEPVSSIPWQHWEMSWLMWKTPYLMRRRTVWCAGSPVVTTQPLMLARLEEHWSTT